MANNKVEAFGQTLIDLTEDKVTPETLAKGVTAHNAAGDKITGTMEGQTMDILSTKEELEANTEAGKVVDALVIKDINSSLNDCKIISEGEGENTKYYLQKGADTASKKLLGKSTLYIKTGLFHDGGSNVSACTYISEDNKNWVAICKTPTVVHNFGSNVWKWSSTYTYGEN